jgi:hypothetical protein
MAAIKTQVLYYFSQENLQKDTFLVSQMDSDMFVPLKVVAQFPKVRALGANVDVIVSALEGAEEVELDKEGQRAKPNIKTQRNTIILRDMPASVPEADIKALFTDSTGHTPVAARADVGDTWFVTMENEEAAVQALPKIRAAKYNDRAVKARLKSENGLKSIIAAASVGAMGAAPMGAGFGAVQPAAGFGFPGGVQLKGGLPRGGAAPASNAGEGAAGVPSSDQMMALLSGSAPTAGYTGKFKQFKRERMMELVAAVPTEYLRTRPEGMDASAHPFAVASEPNMGLISKQRTMSMENAFRKGRPRFESDSSITSTDYRVMMMGETAGGRGPSFDGSVDGGRGRSNNNKKPSGKGGKKSGGAAGAAGQGGSKGGQGKSKSQAEAGGKSKGDQASKAASTSGDAAGSSSSKVVSPPAVPSKAVPSGASDATSAVSADSGSRPKRGWEKPGLPPVKGPTKPPASKASPAAGEEAGETKEAAKKEGGEGKGKGEGRRNRRRGEGKKGGARRASGGEEGAAEVTGASASAPAPAPAPAPTSWGGRSTFAAVLKSPTAAAGKPASGSGEGN